MLKHFHIITSYTVGAQGERSDLVRERLHVSRTCNNCCHNGLLDAEWMAEDGPAKYGDCMSHGGPIEPGQSCGNHRTPSEFERGIRRIDQPVLTLVVGRPR
jgi:hypothetical protein